MRRSLLDRVVWTRPVLDPLTFFILFLGVWWAFVTITGIHPAVLPGPERVVGSLIFSFSALASNMWITLQIVGIGFVLGGALGFGFAVVMTYSERLRRALLPILVGVFVAPKAVFVPLFLLWFGVNDTYKILITLLLVFFPVTENTMAGLRGVEFEMLELVKSYRATRWFTFWKVLLPASIPFVLAGLKIGVTEAFIGAVLAELLAPTSGIGSLIMDASRMQSTSIIVAGIAFIAITGIITYVIFEKVEGRLTAWHY